MQKYFDRLKIAYSSVRTHKVTLQQRLMVYFLIFASVITAVLFIAFAATGMFSFSDKCIGQTLDFSLNTSTSQITEQFDNLTARGFKLSKQLATEADYILEKNNIAFEDINNDSEVIESIEQSVFNPLLSTIEMSECSGVYFVLDATVNTKSPYSKTSRSGVYLRRTSLNDSNSQSDVGLFRGMKAVARKNKLEMHNRWNMEFDIEKIPNYIRIAQDKSLQNPKAFIWSEKTVLFKTWEDAILLSVPVVSDSGKFYGVCGIEISSLFFHLKYSSSESRYGTVVSAVAPVSDGVLKLNGGLCGADDRGKFSEKPLKINFGKYFNTYKPENDSSSAEYMGVQKSIRLCSSEFDGGTDEWVSTVLLPVSSYRGYVLNRKIIITIIIIILMLALIALSFYLTRCCVKPIKQRVKDIQSGNPDNGKSTGLSELDELLAFFYQNRDETGGIVKTNSSSAESDSDVPQGIQEIFDSFIERTERLTDAERNILGYYIKGYQIQDIPDLAYISMSTVRKHNRSIYEKLEVASKDELMLYISMLKRCGRLNDINYPQKNQNDV